ncbi:MAG: hypothetical protein BGO51_11705 [Rhodospirillales bacterium 69-11]|nr:hypothetical protein [Rhodospirillales bacterium]OJW23201.1 MAG: hypothetical protein BGO51_11705 [Rhodospirillales bacterium 69-11]
MRNKKQPSTAAPAGVATTVRTRAVTGDTHTASGAPTDVAHQAAGDGALTGATPAGLTADELRALSKDRGRDDAGSE